MKQRNFFAFTLLIALVGMFTACDTTPPEPVAPSIVVTATVDTVFTDSVFFITVSGSQGDAAMTRIEVQENGTAIAASRLTFDSFAAGSNPSPLTTDAAAAFTWTVGITAGSVDGETSTYNVIITDADGLSASESFDIYTEDYGTPITERTMILLLNQAGPAGTGGLDLETGNSTGTQSDTTADIRDMGIDLGAPSNAENWIQKIATINGSDLRYPAAGLDYDAIMTVEEVAKAFDEGQSFTESDKVEVGDVFLAKSRRGNIYVLKTVNITVTPNDNNDKYEFSVKN